MVKKHVEKTEKKKKKEAVEKFDAKKHLTKLKHRKKEYCKDGKYEDAQGRRFNSVIVESDYLEVKWRLVWLRQGGSGMPARPEWTIKTTLVEIDPAKSFAVFKAELLNGKGRLIASGHRTETKTDWTDFVEKAETGAVGRALAMAGYGTQFAPELEEGKRIVDAPVETKREPEVEKKEVPGAKPSVLPKKEPPSSDKKQESYILMQDFQNKIVNCNTLEDLKATGEQINALKSKLEEKDVETLKDGYRSRKQILEGKGGKQ